MRLVLSFRAETLTLPVHYNLLLQGFIYRHISEEVARWLHDEGVVLGRRKFKGFTFSRLFGRYEVGEGAIRFHGPLRLYVGSVFPEVLESLAENLLREPSLRLGGGECELASVEVEPAPEVGRPELGWAEARVRTLSPITVHRTLYTAEGRRKTYFPSPHEWDFVELVLDNLERKAAALGLDVDELRRGREEGRCSVAPLGVSSRDLKVFKLPHPGGGTVVKAWTGLYKLRLPEPIFWLAYDAGLGDRNAQGFGMVEVVTSRKEV